MFGLTVAIPLRQPDSQLRPGRIRGDQVCRAKDDAVKPKAIPLTTSPHVRKPPLPMKTTWSLSPSSSSFSCRWG